MTSPKSRIRTAWPHSSYAGCRVEDSMSKFHRNARDYFPRLNFNHLQIYVKRWLDKYNEIQIKSILLYRYSCEFVRFDLKMY